MRHMADVFSVAKRTEIMKCIKSKGNKSTELRMIDYFKTNRITGWRRNYNVKGHPDFVFPKQKIAIFVDGCFWHGHNCRNTRPTSNSDYWNKKIQRNIEHDLEITSLFRKRNWNVIRIWECEFKKKNLSILDKKMSILLRP